ncbi:MAG TPA: hypothetical protein VLT60_00475 [Usitatibacter sp.]|nr:hypothetical protein [Usitatibacter sp.]
MAHEIRVDAERGVVRVEIRGTLESAHVAPMATAAREAARANRLPLLYDVREASPGDLKQTDLFWIPRTLPALRGPEARRLRVAMVHDKEECPIVAFWETAFRNVGLPVRAFRDEALALAWLTG